MPMPTGKARSPTVRVLRTIGDDDDAERRRPLPWGLATRRRGDWKKVACKNLVVDSDEKTSRNFFTKFLWKFQ